MSNQQQPVPPPDRPYLLFWFLLTWALMIIALVWGISLYKVETPKTDLNLKDYYLESHFAYYRNGMEKDLQITKGEYLLAQSPPYSIKGKVYGILSAYNPVEEQCDSTPDITASGRKVKEGYVANNCLPFGTIVVINGKQYEVQDRMNSRYGCNHFDILMWSYQEAKDFGRQIQEVEYYK